MGAVGRSFDGEASGRTPTHSFVDHVSVSLGTPGAWRSGTVDLSRPSAERIVLIRTTLWRLPVTMSPASDAMRLAELILSTGQKALLLPIRLPFCDQAVGKLPSFSLGLTH